MKIGHADALIRKGIEARCFNLTTKSPDVGIAEIIGYNKEKAGFLSFRSICQCSRCSQAQGHTQPTKQCIVFVHTMPSVSFFVVPPMSGHLYSAESLYIGVIPYAQGLTYLRR